MGTRLDHGDAEAGEAGDLLGIVGHQPHRLESQAAQHLRRRQIDPLIGVEAQLEIGLQRIGAAVLQAIGPELVDEADAAALLGQIEQQPAALARNLGDGALELVAAVAAQRPQQIAGEAGRMQARQHRAAMLRLADHDGEMLDAAVAGAEGDDAGRLGARQRHLRLADGDEAAAGQGLIARDLADAHGQDVLGGGEGPPVACCGRQQADGDGGEQARLLGERDGGFGIGREIGGDAGQRQAMDGRCSGGGGGIGQPAQQIGLAGGIDRQDADAGTPGGDPALRHQAEGHGARGRQREEDPAGRGFAGPRAAGKQREEPSEVLAVAGLRGASTRAPRRCRPPDRRAAAQLGHGAIDGRYPARRGWSTRR